MNNFSKIKICVVGLGYVGLPLAVAWGKTKIAPVIGFDISKKRILELKKNIDSTGEISSKDLKKANVKYSYNPKIIREANFIVVAVPTPITKNNYPDLSMLKSASKIIGENIKKGTIVVFESTVYPGVTEEICGKIIEKYSGLKSGKDFKLAYSPERINPGDKKHTIDKIIKIISAQDKETLKVVEKVYSLICKAGLYKAPDIKTAEAAKVIENIQRDLNIALVNELSLIFSKLNLDVREVMKAAATKWNIQYFEPGLVGGHCFEKNQFVFLENSGHIKSEKIGNYIEKFQPNWPKEKVRNTTLFYPLNVKILSFDLKTKNPVLKKVICFSKRKYGKKIYKIITKANQKLLVTPKHPVIIWENGFKIKLANEIKNGDKIPVLFELPERKAPEKIDLISYLPKYYREKVRIKPIKKRLKRYKKILQIKKRLGIKSSNFYKYNYLPLSVYLKLEKEGVMPIKRNEIYLVTGRGPSFNKIKNEIKVDKDFARLIGYYLSEGCITKDKSFRVRIVFNENEKEYIKDVTNYIKKLGLKYSLHKSKKCKSLTIKISSNLFGFFLKEVLKCGTNSYNMKIPEQLFLSSKDLQREVLKGILRGDGGVYCYINPKKEYVKNNKKYSHRYVWGDVSFFSASPKLFQQVILLLLGEKYPIRLKGEKPYLIIWGKENLQRIKEFFKGEKKRKLLKYLENRRKNASSKTFQIFDKFFVVEVKEIKEMKTDYVYSVEVEDTNTLITSDGIIAHNCIPVDPYYLTYLAKKIGHHPQIILSGRKVNEYMPYYVATLTFNALKEAKKKIKNSKILILGLTFKANCKDIRNSKIEKTIKKLKQRGCLVFGYDPLLSKKEIELFDIKPINFEKNKRKFDAIILAVGHNQFKKLKIDDLLEVLKYPPILIDVKGIFSKTKKEGIIYKSL